VCVTTLLVPVLEGEAEAMVEGGAAAKDALVPLVARARRWRARVAWVDAVRDELHELLWPLWSAAERPADGPLARVLRLFRKPRPAEPSTGYDPFVQLFGRSLPLDAPTPREVAALLCAVDRLDDAGFDAALLDQLGKLDPRAAQLLAHAPRPGVPEGLGLAIEAAASDVAAAAADPSRPLGDAVAGIARLSAWSQPLWRLDGDGLGEVLSALGVEVVVGPARALFELAVEAHPELEDRRARLPAALPGFEGAGGYLTSADVQLVAGALRLRRGQLAKNAAAAEHPALLMRHGRLLEEAVLYCEAEGLGLLEAAGVEWHARPDPAP
jgi:hypothetical protein